MNGLQEAEHLFEHTMSAHLQELSRYGEVDIVVGIPFYNETDALGSAIRELQNGIKDYCDCRILIVCVGTSAGHSTLERLAKSPVISGEPEVYTFLLDSERLLGKGWGIKALLKVAAKLHSDLVLFEADFLVLQREAESRKWLQLLLNPIKGSGYDLALGCFERHPFTDGLAVHVVSPILASTYGWNITDPLGDEMAISNELINTLLAKTTQWFEDAYQYGIGIWILTTALAAEARVCEASLGTKSVQGHNGKREVMAHQIIRTLLHQIKQHYHKWSQQGDVLRFPGALGVHGCALALEQRPNFDAAVKKFRHGFDASAAGFLKKVLSGRAYAKLNFLAEAPREQFEFPDELWTEISHELLLAYAFHPEYTQDDLVNTLLTILHGRRAYSARHLEGIENKLLPLIITQEATKQIRYFHHQREALIAQWAELDEQVQPVLPKVAFWEFIPGVAMTLPQEVTSSSGRSVSLIPIYESLLREYRQRFASFVQARLDLPDAAPSEQIVTAVIGFMQSLEQRAKEHLLTGNLWSHDGIRENADTLRELYKPNRVFVLTEEAIDHLLNEYPPVHLLTKYSCSTVAKLFERFSPRTALALTACYENRDYTWQVWEWVRRNCGPTDFEERDLELLVIQSIDFYGPSEIRDISKLHRLAGVVILTHLDKHAGGDYPALRYLTIVSKNLCEAQVFSDIWRGFAQGRRKDFARKVANSLEGHWGNALFSAHNIFENGIQRTYTAALRESLAALAEDSTSPDFHRFCQDLILALEVYPLAVTLRDGQFLPLSIWTWASYSYKGGKGVPGPLSLHVERDWFSREILERSYSALEEPWTVNELVIDLMARGSESADLAEFLLPVQHDPRELFEETYVQPSYPETGQLRRFQGNPILSPVKEHDWESTYVLNNGAIRIKDRTYLLYRAFGKDSISRIGLAVTMDGLHISERLPEPIFIPETPEESAGCEDPRIIQIGDRLYMTYTAYDEVVPQIAIASISVDDFLERRWDKWFRHGMAFPNFPNKDAIIFPEKIGGRYAMYHRVAPSIWISYADEITCPWPKTGHKIVMGPRYGMLWDAIKIGAGAQPLKTPYGWLLIYHGVDYAIRYSLGVMLVSLDDPGNLLYRSPNTILAPEEEYEKGVRGQVWVPNVVFTCGAVPARDTDLLEDDDEILVYYGAADTFIGVARAKVSDLIPEAIREKTKEGRGVKAPAVMTLT